MTRKLHVTGTVWVGQHRAYGLTDTARCDQWVDVEPGPGWTEAQVQAVAMRTALEWLRWADYDHPRPIPGAPLLVKEVGSEPIDVVLRREGAPLLPGF